MRRTGSPASAAAPSRGFENNKYASGRFFDKLHQPGVGAGDAEGARPVRRGRHPHPQPAGLAGLKDAVARDGIYNQNLQAVPPSSILHQPFDKLDPPVAAKIEILQRAKIGPSTTRRPTMTSDNLELPGRVRDRLRRGHRHVCGRIAPSTRAWKLVAVLRNTADARCQQGAESAWRKGIRRCTTSRLRQMALEEPRWRVAYPACCGCCDATIARCFTVVGC